MTTKWNVVDAPNLDSITHQTTPQPISGGKVLRMIRVPTAHTKIGLDHPKLVGFPTIPDGFPGGNGPLGLGDTHYGGWGVYVPLDFPVADGDDLIFGIFSTPDPTSSPPSVTGWFADPSVSSGGDGSEGDPWSVANAFTNPGGVIDPGDDLYIRAGQTSGDLSIGISGDSGAKVNIRNYPGEIWRHTGQLLIPSTTSYMRLWGSRFGIQVWPLTTTADAGNLKFGIVQDGPFTDIIHVVVREIRSSGILTRAAARGGKIYDSIVFNNGTDTNKDHNIYGQNELEEKHLDNIHSFNPGAYAYHMYASTPAQFQRNLKITRCSSAGKGYNANRPDLLIASTDTTKGLVTVEDFYTWRQNRADSNGSGDLGYSAGPQSGTLALNRLLFLGSVNIPGARWTTITGGGTVRSIGSGGTVPDEVHVFPSLVQSKYAHLAIYNGALASTVDVNFGAMGLETGDSVDVFSAYDLTTPVLNFTFDAETPIVAVPMDSVVSPAAQFGGSTMDPMPQFGQFIVIGPGVGSPPAPPDFAELRNPIVQLVIRAGAEWEWGTRTDPDAYPSEDPDPSLTVQSTTDIVKGQWTIFKYQVTLAIDGTGLLRVWQVDGLDGTERQIVNVSGANAYNALYPGFIRLCLDEAPA